MTTPAQSLIRLLAEHPCEVNMMTSAERFSLAYELRAPVELTTGWGEANGESDATDDESEEEDLC